MVFIKELLPNPAGKDTAGEWLTLVNDGTGAVNLHGWSIKDASGKQFTLGDQILLPHEEVKLPYSLTRVNLNNDGDTITLWNAAAQKTDELSYGPVGEEEIVVSSKVVPPAEADQSIDASPLAAQAFTGRAITAKEISPFFLAFGLALAFAILATILTKKLIRPE